MAEILKVKNWDMLYENNRSRQIKRHTWFAMPNDFGSETYAAIIDHPDGAAHFGCLVACLMVASSSFPRGSLVRQNGEPHEAKSLARLTRLPESLFSEALPRFIENGILETCSKKTRKANKLSSHPTAAPSQEGAPASRVMEGNRRNGRNRTEWKEKEKISTTTRSVTSEKQINSSSEQESSPYGKSEHWWDAEQVQKYQKSLGEHFGKRNEPDAQLVQKVLAHFANSAEAEDWLADMRERFSDGEAFKSYGIYLHDAKEVWPSQRERWFQERLKAVRRREQQQRVEVVAQRCRERGWKPVTTETTCPNCAGFGRSPETEQVCSCVSGTELAHREELARTECPRCGHDGVLPPGNAGYGKILSWCDCVNAQKLRQKNPDFVGNWNAEVERINSHRAARNH